MPDCRLCPRQCGADRAVSAGRVPYGKRPCAWRAPRGTTARSPASAASGGAARCSSPGVRSAAYTARTTRSAAGRIGETVSLERLAAIFAGLEAKGVHNLNLVTGTQFTPEIREALAIAKPKIPVVWNTSGYETVDTVDALAPQVSVFLPDLKYTDPALAARYSWRAGLSGGGKKCHKAYGRAHGRVRAGRKRPSPPRRYDPASRAAGADRKYARRAFLDRGHGFAPGTVLVSLMAQYTPCGDLKKFPELRRTLTPEEWDAALAALDETGLSDGYVQELSASGEEEIPAFDGTGVIS